MHVAHPPILSFLYRKPLQDDLVELRRQLAMVAQRPCGFKANDIYPFQEKVKWGRTM